MPQFRISNAAVADPEKRLSNGARKLRVCSTLPKAMESQKVSIAK